MNIGLRNLVFKNTLIFKIFREFLYHIHSKESISVSRPSRISSCIIDNNVYGNFLILDYLNLDENWFIEHGLFFGRHVQTDTFSYGNKVITFSEYRRKKLLKVNPEAEIKVVGPYIRYFEGKDILDGVSDYLLVFPPHSSKVFASNFSLKEFKDKIKALYRNSECSSVVLCWYYLDYREDFDLGEEIELYNTSCGHRWSNEFTNNLRYLIDNSRNTLSFNVGTHVGYCIVLNKPHSITELNWRQIQKSIISERDLHLRQDDERALVMNLVKKEFLVKKRLNMSITLKQKQIVDEYWGL